MSDKIKPMNLLYLFSDQHSKFVTGCYGNAYVHTPNLDYLAENGVCFDNAYSNNPICVPARAAMTVGDYCFKNHYWDNAHPYNGKQEGWGHRLTSQGIPVTTIGKLHYQSDAPETGFPDQRIPLHVKGGTGDMTHLVRDGSMVRPAMRQEVLGAGPGESDYLRYDEKVAGMAAEFLRGEALERNAPWCLYVGFVCPHFPWKVPDDIMELYTPYDKLPLPVDWEEDRRTKHPAIVRYRDEMCLTEMFSKEEMQKAIASYYGMVTFMDRQIGVVLDALKEAGLWDRTRVIYGDDHGEMAGDHGLFFKHTLYEGSVGVPLIVSGPDIPKGKRISTPVSLVDMFPTILECVGATKESRDKHLPGVSLLDIIDGSFDTERAVFAETHCIGFNDAAFMVRYRQYKYIYYVKYEPQLFDLEKDPREQNDLINNPAYQDIRREMDNLLREKFCDPEKINSQAKAEQEKLLEINGGKEAVLKTLVSFSPIPSGTL